MIAGQIPSSFQLGHGGHGILLMHGFCGSSCQMRFLAQGLHENGYTVSVPLLPGHGSRLQDMNYTSCWEWLTCVRRAYTSLWAECASVSVIGHSMGGVLALILAEEYPADAVITLAAPMRLSGVRALFAPFARPVSLFLPYLYRLENMRYPEGFLLTDHIGYDGLPVARVHDLRKLILLARRNLFAVTAPLLAVQAEDDAAVSHTSPGVIASGVSSRIRQTRFLPEGGHLLPLCPQRETLLQIILSFLEKNIKK